MPIPKPNEGEPEKDFISRCMGDEAMQEYDSEQRAAVCATAWDDSQKTGEEEGKATLRLQVFERKSHPSEIKLVNADEGVWECYASTFKPTPDPYGDVVDKGAFKRTIKENFKRIRNLWNHNVDEPIGRPLALSEDDHGLYAKNKLSLGVQRAKDVRELMADGVINETSIGFDTITDRVKEGFRHLVEVRLWDISPVTYGANEEAAVLSVKNTLETLRLKGLPDELLRELLNLPPEITPEQLKRGIAALQALRPGSAKGAVTDAPATDAEAEAAELEAAMADFEAARMGIDVRDATARIEELLATL